MPYDCKKQADFMRNEGIFVKESNFFRDIVPLLEKHCKTDKWHPTCYVAKEDAMIMEDLRVQGYRVLDKTFDDTKALKSVLVSLARLHSCSIITENYLNRNSKVLFIEILIRTFFFSSYTSLFAAIHSVK